tara:strand:+ start:527 stop:1237 length:711 start_codon:yes stop_codon:yes gene_type:complete
MVKKNLVASFLLLFGSNLLMGHSVSALEPFKVTYNIHKGPLKVGSISRSLRIENDGQYTFISRMESSGFAKFLSGSLLLETSKGRIVKDKIIPYSYRRETDKQDKNYELNFDRKNNLVKRIDVAEGYEEILKEDTFDKLSYQAQMMMDLSSTFNENLKYAIASQKKIVTYDVILIKEKKISTPMGKLKTLVINRKDPNSSKETTVYCAKELDWLPVRIEHTDKKGRSMAAKIESYN